MPYTDKEKYALLNSLQWWTTVDKNGNIYRVRLNLPTIRGSYRGPYNEPIITRLEWKYETTNVKTTDVNIEQLNGILSLRKPIVLKASMWEYYYAEWVMLIHEVPYDQLPLYINSCTSIAKWRLQIGR